MHVFGGFCDAEFHQVFKGGQTCSALEAAAALTFADKDGFCDIIERDRFHKMLLYVDHCLLDALRILIGDARSDLIRSSSPARELVIKELPQLQYACFAQKFIAGRALLVKRKQLF